MQFNCWLCLYYERLNENDLKIEIVIEFNKLRAPEATFPYSHLFLFFNTFVVDRTPGLFSDAKGVVVCWS